MFTDVFVIKSICICNQGFYWNMHERVCVWIYRRACDYRPLPAPRHTNVHVQFGVRKHSLPLWPVLTKTNTQPKMRTGSVVVCENSVSNSVKFFHKNKRLVWLQALKWEDRDDARAVKETRVSSPHFSYAEIVTFTESPYWTACMFGIIRWKDRRHARSFITGCHIFKHQLARASWRSDKCPVANTDDEETISLGLGKSFRLYIKKKNNQIKNRAWKRSLN